MRFLRLLLFVITACVASASVGPAPFTWTGGAGDHDYANPANWAGGVVPPNDGSATVMFGNANDTTVVLPFFVDVAQIQFQNSSTRPYTFNTGLLTFLTVENGLSNTAGGNVRLGNNITLNLAGTQFFNITSGNVEVTGGLIGSGTMVKTGSGTLRLNGFNIFSGNTQVTEGALIFGNTASLPSGVITSSKTGYVGAENQATLKDMIGQLSSHGFAGSIGLDTAPGVSAPVVFSDQVDVTNLPDYAGLGSTTSARLVGNFRVNAYQDYRFNGGAGTLYVETNLTNAHSNLQVRSTFGTPLSVFLRGSNNFAGAVQVTNSVLVLDSHQAVSSGKLLNIEGAGYIGATEKFATSANGFLSLLQTNNSNAIAGFDSADLNSPRVINEAIDLSVGGTRTDPYYLGTTTKVSIYGKITPTVGDGLYLTAVKGGYLTIGSVLGSNIPNVTVGQADSFDPQGGTVDITGSNSYTGGTRVLGGTLRVSSNAALGTGGVEVSNRGTLDIASGVTFSNSLSLASGARLGGNGIVATPGGVIFGPGTILSPGGVNRVGALAFTTGITLAGGSTIEFDIANLSAGPGVGWDYIFASKGVNLTATSLSPITLDLTTLTLSGTPGLLSGFDANQSYSWLFMSGTVSGYSTDKFIFDTSNFANSLGGGTFSLVQGNAGLSINFTPVPEPSTYILYALGLSVIAILELRRRKK
ncbi:MAG: autotransporter-associated beta strand repeat-containing protein [Nibricoccus sp.]